MPDLLGYGDTDKPRDLEAYAMKRMSGHVVETFGEGGVGKVRWGRACFVSLDFCSGRGHRGQCSFLYAGALCLSLLSLYTW